MRQHHWSLSGFVFVGVWEVNVLLWEHCEGNKLSTENKGGGGRASTVSPRFPHKPRHLPPWWPVCSTSHFCAYFCFVFFPPRLSPTALVAAAELPGSACSWRRKYAHAFEPQWRRLPTLRLVCPVLSLSLPLSSFLWMNSVFSSYKQLREKGTLRAQ